MLALAVLTGCNASDETDATASSASSVPSVTIATTGSTPDDAGTARASTTAAPKEAQAPTSDPQATVVDLTPPDAPNLLGQAIDSATGGYHFVTTVTLGSEIALQAEGDRIGGNTRMAVSSNGATVDYVITSDSSWVAENGTWQELDEPPPVVDPLSALATPTSIDVASYDTSGATLAATYPSAAFALPGDAVIDVAIEVVGTNLSAIEYTAPGSTPPATVRTVLSPLTDTTPVTPPGT